MRIKFDFFRSLDQSWHISPKLRVGPSVWFGPEVIGDPNAVRIPDDP
jgi:hypothetical protein